MSCVSTGGEKELRQILEECGYKGSSQDGEGICRDRGEISLSLQKNVIFEEDMVKGIIRCLEIMEEKEGN